MSTDTCHIHTLFFSALQQPGPIAWVWQTCLCFMGLTYVASLASGNYSQVDKLWSVTPVIYAWMLVVVVDDNNDSRTLLMAVLVTLWGCRLTYNFHRRGGYRWPPWTGDQDYRWAYLQKGFYIAALQNRIVWHVFNFVFISVYQNILLCLLAMPSAVAYLVAVNYNGCFPDATTACNVLDYVATILLLAFLYLETKADNTQYAFQTEKYRLQQAGATRHGHFRDGFCQSGVYAWMRKPNYTGEQGIWCAYYLFSVASLWSVHTIPWYARCCNASVTGCVLLMLLFQGSGHMTEQISITKYPAYKEYQKKVPLYVPKLSMLLKRKAA